MSWGGIILVRRDAGECTVGTWGDYVQAKKELLRVACKTPPLGGRVDEWVGECSCFEQKLKEDNDRVYTCHCAERGKVSEGGPEMGVAKGAVEKL